MYFHVQICMYRVEVTYHSSVDGLYGHEENGMVGCVSYVTIQSIHKRTSDAKNGVITYNGWRKKDSELKGAESKYSYASISSAVRMVAVLVLRAEASRSHRSWTRLLADTAS